MITASEPIFAVADVRATVKFYREVLGFERDWFWCDDGGDVHTFAGVGLGGIHVMLSLQPELQARVHGHEHWFRVDDVQALYERHRAAGAKIVSDIENKPWGFREYTVRDLNGHHLRFAGQAKYERSPTATDVLPDYVRLELRKPTLDEYTSLFKAVDGRSI